MNERTHVAALVIRALQEGVGAGQLPDRDTLHAADVAYGHSLGMADDDELLLANSQAADVATKTGGGPIQRKSAWAAVWCSAVEGIHDFGEGPFYVGFYKSMSAARTLAEEIIEHHKDQS